MVDLPSGGGRVFRGRQGGHFLAAAKNVSFHHASVGELPLPDGSLDFTRVQIGDMLTTAGFQDIRFSERVPYWCAVGIKR